MKKISIKIWLPIIVILFIAVSLAIYFSLPREEKAPEITLKKGIAPEIPADWKTYIDWGYDFEVRYPPKIVYLQEDYFLLTPKEGIRQGIVMKIRQDDYPLLGISIDESRDFSEFSTCFYDIPEYFNIDGEPAQKCFTKFFGEFEPEFYNAYEIEILHNKSKYRLFCQDLSYESLCDKIFSTFNFLE